MKVRKHKMMHFFLYFGFILGVFLHFEFLSILLHFPSFFMSDCTMVKL